MRIKGAALVAAAALILTSCGGGDDAATSSSAADPCKPGVNLEKHPECVNNPAIEGVDPEGETEDSRPAANPVTIAKKIPGCELPKGAAVGEQGGDGERTADCEVYRSPAAKEEGSATAVTVTTLPAPTPPGWSPEDLEPDDSHHIVTGDGFTIEITGRADGTFDITAKQVAKATGGKVLTP